MTESYAHCPQSPPSEAARPTGPGVSGEMTGGFPSGELSPSLRIHSPEPPPTNEVPPSPAEQQAAAIVDGVLKAAHRMRGLLSTHFSEFDLTDVRYSVLRFLYDSAPNGCTQSELAGCLDQSESSVSTLVKRMRNSELLYRLRSGIDKRKRVLKLTERGRSLFDAVCHCHARRMDELLQAFDAPQRTQLAEL
ncbi:MAG: MarR family winged helix-turn-helix transcriptional regulator, partial [Planctomycetaceae bacterium]